MPAATDYERLEAALGHRFLNRELLITALTHRSFANEKPEQVGSDNERLEFLGDAVLDLCIGHMLMEAFPTLREGELSVTRARIVSEVGLADVARCLDLGAWLRLGNGEERSGGRDKPSLLADAVEAVIAAVYLDGGFATARALIARLFGDRLAAEPDAGFYDYKTRLQELAQARLKASPVYRLISDAGPDHAKTFEVAVLLGDREYARAAGKSKKEAEQAAARQAFELLTEARDAE